MPRNFFHLHVHSHYSLLDGLPKIDELLKEAKNQGMNALALTDHGTLYGVVEGYLKAKELNLKLILGEEFYLAYERMDQRRPNIDNQRYHVILLAKNSEGYQNLVKLTTKAWLEGFYYKPRIDEKLLFENSKGLICLTACLQGKIPQLILANKTQEAEKLAKKYQEVFGSENFYLEIQHHPNLKEQNIVNKALIQMAKKCGFNLVATNDVHYLKKEDAQAQDILMQINTNSRPDDPERLTMIADDFSFRTPKEMIEAFKEVPEAIENTEKIVNLCNFNFTLGQILLPCFHIESKDPNDYLRELCYQNLGKKKIAGTKEEIIKRLEYELSIIKKMNFATYFLIVQDIVNWAKSNKIVVGPGRGSVAGSLVAYLLNITEVDPLKYGLLFERFLNPERQAGLPDIDLDFADRRRDEVIEYVSQKYGRENVARIITFGTMAARQVVRDVGRALGYPYKFCDQIAKLIPPHLPLKEVLETVPEIQKSYFSDPKVKKLIDISLKLEGVARHASTHACGVVISPKKITEFTPLQFASQDDKTIITQFDMYSIEKLGLLKMDFLGLTNLTIIEDTIRVIRKLHQIEIDISKIPLDDRATFQLLQKGDTTGVFQLESEGMRKCLQEFKPKSIDDIIIILALYRPGPMKLIPSFLARKNKKEKVTYLHPDLEEILKPTYGFPIFQEQIMLIAQKLAGFTLGEADYLRKAIGKKDEKLLLSLKDKMIKGMIERGISKDVALKIWEWILPFGNYGFNKSHAAAYALIAYQTAYLKAHFPVEFMAVLMNSEQKNIDKLKILLEEARKMGIKVLPPDINESKSRFTIVGKKVIRFGLGAIKNVGANIVEFIEKEREKNGPFSSVENFLERMPSSILNKKSLESMIKAGAFDRLGERETLLWNLEKLLEYARDANFKKILGHNSLFGSKKSFTLKLEPPPRKSSPLERTFWERELLGVFISNHPMIALRKRVKNTLLLKDLNLSFIAQRITIAGIVTNIKRVLTKTKKTMLFVKLEDESGEIEAVVFPELVEKYFSLFQENKILKIKGKLTQRDNDLSIICEEAEKLI